MMKVMMKFICSVGNKSTDKQHPINIGNKEINILIDSGSTLNGLDEKTHKMFDPVTILVSSETMAYYVPDAKTCFSRCITNSTWSNITEAENR